MKNLESFKEVLLKLYDYFNLEYGDVVVFEKLVDELVYLSTNAEWDRVKEILDDKSDPLFFINRSFIVNHYFNLNLNYEEFSKFLEAWSDNTAKLLLRVVKTTKEYDFLIQQILNYEDFLFYEMRKNKLRKKIACEIYDLRGIDFFLIHYMQHMTSALEDEALWRNAELISEFLKEFNRFEEAYYVESEIQKRKEKLKEIKVDFADNDEANKLTVIENRLKLLGERFWIEYLSVEVWKSLMQESQKDLIDSYVLEFFLKKSILNCWSQVVLTLCKILERELSFIIFSKWIELIKQADFIMPQNLSPKEQKELQPREFTFKVLKSCVVGKIHPPTLGQMIFVIKFWEDKLMNRCTTLFNNINHRIRNKSDFLEKLSKLNYWLEERHILDGERPTVIDLRNSSAHPGSELEYSWNRHIEWLKNFLGKPPKEALKIIVSLKENLNDIA